MCHQTGKEVVRGQRMRPGHKGNELPVERPGIPPDSTGSGPKPNETHHGYDFQRRIVPWVSYPAISGSARGPEKREQERQSSSQNSCLGRSREKPHAQQAPRGRKPVRLGQGSECALTAFLYLPTNSCGSRFSTSGLSCKTEPKIQGGKHGISDPKSLSTETSEDTQGREKSEGTAGNPGSEPMLRGLLGPLNPFFPYQNSQDAPVTHFSLSSMASSRANTHQG